MRLYCHGSCAEQPAIKRFQGNSLPPEWSAQHLGSSGISASKTGTIITAFHQPPVSRLALRLVGFTFRCELFQAFPRQLAGLLGLDENVFCQIFYCGVPDLLEIEDVPNKAKH